MMPKGLGIAVPGDIFPMADSPNISGLARNSDLEPSMTRKKLSDCVQCPHMSTCDAHITGGSHEHREGPDPCELNLESECSRDDQNRLDMDRFIRSILSP